MRAFPRIGLLGSVIVSLAASCGYGPGFSETPSDVTVFEGETATFVARPASREEVTYQWQRSDDGYTFEDLLDASAATTTLVLPSVSLDDDGAQFRALIRFGTYGDISTSPAASLTVLPVDCVLPPFPAVDRTAPPATTPPTATFGANLLANPGFETTAWVGAPPSDFGYWRFDESASVPAQQGIAPRSGTGMLQFVSSVADISVSGGASASEQIQVVDVSGVQAAIDAGTVRLHASAWFARVAGCATTDDAFGIYVAAFDGDLTTYFARWNNGIDAAAAQGVDRDVADMTGVDGWLMHRTARLRHNDPDDRIETADGPVFDWREVTLEADLPAGTTLLMIGVYALENVVNDTTFPEFHGHYADDIAVVLEPRDP